MSDETPAGWVGPPVTRIWDRDFNEVERPDQRHNRFIADAVEYDVRAEIYRRAGDAILEKYPDIQDWVIPEVVKAVLDATVEAEADNYMRAYMTLIGWR